MIIPDINMILSIGAALLGFGSLLLTLRAKQRWQSRCQALEASLAGVRREMEHVVSISMRTGRRIKRIENEYSGVSDRVDQVELRGPAQSIDQAIDMARRGADPVKLTQHFGLSRGEADLVMRLHGRRTSAHAV